ncbi:MAG: glycosyltransferase family 4 protein [Nocardioides sp.]|nr:glycosyltransferase family 4 protein [Nocardioides sp.]
MSPISLHGRHIVFFSWRDTRNPEGGGAEVYLEQIARGLGARGARVSIFCAEHGAAPRDEVVDGVRFHRRGSKMAVYARGLLALATGRFGRHDLIVDVQNGMPFFTRLLSRKPVVVLVHHVHREQWPVVYPGLTGRIGWWIESRLAPRLYRGSQYVAVSRATLEELVGLGIDRSRIAVVHNGTEQPAAMDIDKSPEPSVCTVGRLVPHKQVEQAIDACVRLREELPDLCLTVVGDGWWAEQLEAHAASVGAAEWVRFLGHVDEERKHQIYAESWVMALPSLKEGWGLVIGEAGMHRTPTVAYRSAGGTQESINDGFSGILAEDFEGFVEGLRRILNDEHLLKELSSGARSMSQHYTWEHAQHSFALVVTTVLEGERVHTSDPEGENPPPGPML